MRECASKQERETSKRDVNQASESERTNKQVRERESEQASARKSKRESKQARGQVSEGASDRTRK